MSISFLARRRWRILLALWTSLGSTWLCGQSIAAEALKTFPSYTARLDYLSMTQVRRVPDVERLMTRSKLRALAQELEEAGIHKQDIDEVVLGWRAGDSPEDFYGIAGGRFGVSWSALESHRATTAAHADADKAVCSQLQFRYGKEDVCFLRVGHNRVLFGNPASLQEMTSVRRSKLSAIASDSALAKLFLASHDLPAHGAAVGSGVVDWFQTWLSGERDVKSNWARTLKGVDSLSYEIRLGSELTLYLNLHSQNSDDAEHITSVLGSFVSIAQAAARNRRSRSDYSITSFRAVTDKTNSLLDISVSNASKEASAANSRTK